MSTPQHNSIGSFVAQDYLAWAAGMRLAAGAGRNLLNFAARFNKSRHLASQIISITNGKIFFRLGHAVNLWVHREKPMIIHHFR